MTLFGLGALVSEPARLSDDGGWLLEAYAPLSILDPQFEPFEDSAVKAASSTGASGTATARMWGRIPPTRRELPCGHGQG